MQSKEAIETGLADIISKYGKFSFDIPLPFGIWTNGNLQHAHTRLKRIIQASSDLVGKPLSECSVLDLGCLDGMFTIEFALHGAKAVGVEVRESHVKKAMFCKEILELSNLTFVQDDARNISKEALGSFDIIVCSGLLYHLTAEDAIGLVEKMYSMTNRLLIIDTQIGLIPEIKVTKNGEDYYGVEYIEHSDADTQDKKSKKLWASWDNAKSFWFTRPSLTNLLKKVGFSSIHESYIPGEFEYRDRVTFVSVKGTVKELFTSPAVNSLSVSFPEEGGKVALKNDFNKNLFLQKVKGKLSQIKNKFG